MFINYSLAKYIHKIYSGYISVDINKCLVW